jgi:ABC-type glycerol-3-phosphate transport system permease component
MAAARSNSTALLSALRWPVSAALLLLLVGAGALVAFPFLWMLLTALKTLPEAQAFPPELLPAHPQWHNFVEALQAGGQATFVRYFGNSAIVSAASTAGVVVTALLAGYAFGALEFPGRQAIFSVYLGTMMIPFEVIMIPNVLTINTLGWNDRYAGLIVPWLANVFAIFLVTQRFRSLPREYFEAAQLDGCTHWQFLWRIGRPLAQPALATAALFAFLGSWNSLLWPLVATQSPEMRTVELGLAVFLSEEQTQFHLLMAISTLAMLPVLIVFLLAQRTFIESAAAGLKG